jgi:hypothetical protein
MMFIQTEATPNPATMKFLPGRAVLELQRASRRRMTAWLCGLCSTYSAIRIVRFSDSNRIGSHH